MSDPPSAGPGPAAHRMERPVWWPDNERWPPVRRWRRFGHRPHRSAPWRAGCFVLSLGILVSLGCGLTFGLGAYLTRLLPLPGDAVPYLAGAALLLMGVMMTTAYALRRVGRPVQNLIAAAERIETGDFSTRVPERGPRETRALARAFNHMASQLEADEVNRRTLLAGIGHELLTPLAVIRGNLEALIDGVYSPDAARLASMLEETHLMGRLVEDIRTLSQVESGTLRLAVEPIELTSFGPEALGRFQPQADLAHVTLDASIPSDIPPVLADPDRLQQVLGNLLSNALRYSAAGQSITLEAARGPAGFASIRVRDHGTGIAPQDLPHVFERFYKSSDSRGSGLGLSIAQSLIRSMGGEITAESKPGSGTVMTFTVPIDD
jgi:two-component system sensor histidine kinase BaeS